MPLIKAITDTLLQAGEIHNFGNFSNSDIHSLVTGVHLTLLHYIMKVCMADIGIYFK